MPPKYKPLVNGQNYSWGEIDFIIFGVPVIGITKISWDRKQDRPNNYGAGNEPVSYGEGNATYEGSVTLFNDELLALEDVAPDGLVTKIPPFTTIVSYGLVSKPRVKKLKNLRFTSDNLVANQGETVLYSDVPFVFAGIE